MTKKLVDVIDDGVASNTQFMNDFEFCPWFLKVCGRSVFGRVVLATKSRHKSQPQNGQEKEISLPFGFSCCAAG